MKTQVMLDLETLGSRPGAVVVSVGAVKFGGGRIHDTFYARIEPQSCIDAGLKMDVQAVTFWLRQPDEARLELLGPSEPLNVVLLRFATWIAGNEEGADVWGNGAGFDNVIWRTAYEMAAIPVPWDWRNDRCYRTVRKLHPEVPMPERTGVKHHALEDARHQAEHLMMMLGDVGEPSENTGETPALL